LALGVLASISLVEPGFGLLQSGQQQTHCLFHVPWVSTGDWDKQLQLRPADSTHSQQAVQALAKNKTKARHIQEPGNAPTRQQHKVWC
jgi:hypothetical protein